MTKLSPVHPGEVLREDFLTPNALSANRLAMDLRVPASRIGEIIHGRRSVTAETALRLARYFGTTAEFWLNLQSHYDLQVAKDASAEAIARDVRPLCTA
jgi:addiction module HigA family antidote